MAYGFDVTDCDFKRWLQETRIEYAAVRSLTLVRKYANMNAGEMDASNERIAVPGR